MFTIVLDMGHLVAFPEELFVQPINFLGGKFKNIVSYTDMPSGGHFAAFEEPELLSKDIIQFVQKATSMPVKTELWLIN